LSILQQATGSKPQIVGRLLQKFGHIAEFFRLGEVGMMVEVVGFRHHKENQILDLPFLPVNLFPCILHVVSPSFPPL